MNENLEFKTTDDDCLPDCASSGSVRSVGIVVLLTTVFFAASLWILVKRVGRAEENLRQFRAATEHNLGVVVSVVNNQGMQLSNYVARATNNVEKK